MAALFSKLEFSYRGMEVGYFKGLSFPEEAGRYRYEPYRGPGHYQMQLAREKGERPLCEGRTAGRVVRFEVVDCPEYGVLELAGFEVEEDAK